MQLPAWLAWLLPYRTHALSVPQPPNAILALFDTFSLDGLAIGGATRFDQGRYRVRVNQRAIAIIGPRHDSPYGQSRFPLATRIRVQPVSSHQTRLCLSIRPTLAALLPICTAALLLLLALIGFTDETGLPLRLFLQLLSWLFAGTYAAILLFFQIEVNTLLRVLRRELQLPPAIS